MSIFKKSSVKEEVIQEMNKNIDSMQDDYDSKELLLKLNSIAILLQKNKKNKEAEIITCIIEKLASLSEKLVLNLKENGTPFPSKDYAKSDDLEINKEDEDQIESMMSSFDDEQ